MGGWVGTVPGSVHITPGVRRKTWVTPRTQPHAAAQRHL